MADIKTRDVSRGTIKTLDRAASSMHHLKEETIRSRASESGNRYDNDPSGSYAQDVTEQSAAAGAAFAARSGIEMLLELRRKASYGSELPAAEGEAVLQSVMNTPGEVTAEADVSDQISHAYRKHSVDMIRGRQRRAKAAKEETIRNAMEERYSGRIKNASAASGKQPLKTESLMHKRRKEHAIRKITERNVGKGIIGQITARRGNALNGRTARRTGSALRRMIESSRALFGTISVSGAVAAGIIVIMVFFGAAITMNEDGSYMTGSGDATIVEVARGELGNVGGNKFWKWYGFKSHVHWCACFVSWCADQCGYIEMGIVPKFALVGNGASWFKARHRWAGRGYKPKPGDIIFFDYEQDGVFDHVGIVETGDGKTVTTIEGNSGNVCRRQSYRAGSPQIAGYGLLLIPGGGNRSQMIARKAIQLAYPNAPREARYNGGKPTAAYKAALDRAYPHRSGWNAASKAGASCDVFVGVCLVDSGVDKNFPRGYEDQAERLDKKKDLYQCVINTKSRNIKESELKDGDIIRYRRNSGGVHIFIYAGGKIRHAGIAKWYPRSSSPDSRLKISGKKQIWVYRVKD